MNSNSLLKSIKKVKKGSNQRKVHIKDSVSLIKYLKVNIFVKSNNH
jgi:hypothetical protein